MERHSLLARQLKRHGAGAHLGAGAEAFLRAVDTAYRQADDDRALLERSLELTSQEMARDLEELTSAKKALMESRAFLEKAQEVAQVGSWAAPLTGPERLIWSKECFRIFGMEDAGSVDLPRFIEAVDPDDRPEVLRVRESARRGEIDSLSLDYRIRRADGAVRWVHSRADLIRDAGGAPAKLIGILQDVTEHRELEERLRRSQKMEAVGRLAGGIAHDFNNLLTAVKGYSALLKLSLPEGSGPRSDVEEIEKAADRAALLTRQLLAFSRKQVLVPVVLDINGTLLGLEAMMRCMLREDVRLDMRLAAGLGAVKADPGQLTQVLMNLVVNARDAMPNGGRLAVETRNVPARDCPLEVDGVRITVSDSGVGMTPEVAARIFEPFFTTKPVGKGTGLGLSTVYGIVSQSGGHVSVDSAPGRGTSFGIHLPRLAGAPATWAEESPAGAHALRGEETLLVVEDESAVRSPLCRTLRGLGYEVIEASSGEEALRLFDARHGSIDALVTDIIMPGMNGRELAERLLSRRPGLRLLYISGYTDDVIARHGVLEPGTPFLQKPFAPTALAERLRELLAGPAAR